MNSQLPCFLIQLTIEFMIIKSCLVHARVMEDMCQNQVKKQAIERDYDIITVIEISRRVIEL